MALRIPNSYPGVGSPQQVNSTPQVDDPSVGGAEAVGKKKTSKKGIADFNDSFEATPQGLQQPSPNAPQLQGVQQAQQTAEAKAGAAEGTSNKRGSFFDINERTREHIDETGYKWTSWRFEPPTVKHSEGIDKEDPLNQEALERLAEMWKDAAEKAQFSNIRA